MDLASDTCHQDIVLNSVEEFRQIHIDTVTIAGSNVSLYLLRCLLSRTLWSETETRFREIRIEDRCQDLKDGLLEQSFLDIGNAQISLRAIWLGNGFPASRFEVINGISLSRIVQPFPSPLDLEGRYYGLC